MVDPGKAVKAAPGRRTPHAPRFNTAHATESCCNKGHNLTRRNFCLTICGAINKLAASYFESACASD
jgi:hypothetical protein